MWRRSDFGCVDAECILGPAAHPCGALRKLSSHTTSLTVPHSTQPGYSNYSTFVCGEEREKDVFPNFTAV